MVLTTSSSLEDGEQGGRQLVRILGTQQQALAVVGDAPEDVPLLLLEGEAHDMGRHRRGPGVRRGGRGARVTATGLETIGHEHHRIDGAWVGRPEVPRRPLEGEGERRPAGGTRRIDLAVDGRLVHAIDGHQQVRGTTADGLARGGVVPPVTVDPEADVDTLPLGDGRHHPLEHPLGDLHPGLAADALLHRARGVEDELDVDGRGGDLVARAVGRGSGRGGRRAGGWQAEPRDRHDDAQQQATRQRPSSDASIAWSSLPMGQDPKPTGRMLDAAC